MHALIGLGVYLWFTAVFAMCFSFFPFDWYCWNYYFRLICLSMVCLRLVDLGGLFSGYVFALFWVCSFRFLWWCGLAIMLLLTRVCDLL